MDSPSGNEILRVLDIPKKLQSVSRTTNLGVPFGAKEVGETTREAISTAISNAICNAIGARNHSLPMTPNRILEARTNKVK